MERVESLNRYKVGSLPTLYYIPNFVKDNEQTSLLHNIYGASTSKWKTLKNRRLQNWGGVVHEKGLLPQDLPSWLTHITQKIYEESGLLPSAINHVLINEYLPNQGIMPHQDGPAYFPVVAILSLGSPVVMNFTPHSSLRLSQDKWLDDHHPFSILLMPQSLLIFKDMAYSDYLHGIEDSSVHQYYGAVNEVEALKQHRVQDHQPFSLDEDDEFLLEKDIKLANSILWRTLSSSTFQLSAPKCSPSAPTTTYSIDRHLESWRKDRLQQYFEAVDTSNVTRDSDFLDEWKR